MSIQALGVFCREFYYLPNRSRWIDADSEFAEDLISYLGKKRFEDAYWKDVGRAIYQASRHWYNGLNEWIKYSKKYRKGYREGDCEVMWMTYGEINKSKRSLYVLDLVNWVRLDNLGSEYDKIMKNYEGHIDIKNVDLNNLKYKFFYSRCLNFTNGIYDIKKRVFRDWKPSDGRFDHKLNYEFHEYSMDSSEIMEVKEYIKSLFPDPKVREDQYRFLSSLLNVEKRVGNNIQFWYGERGANGRSSLLNLLEKCFGDYFIKLSGRRRDDHELTRLEGHKVASIQELDGNEQIDIGLLKQLTSGDSIFIRPLYGAPKHITPEVKVIGITNYVDSIPKEIKTVEFVNQFVTEPNGSNQLLRETCLDWKQEQWKGAFMYLLIQKYHEFWR